MARSGDTSTALAAAVVTGLLLSFRSCGAFAWDWSLEGVGVALEWAPKLKSRSATMSLGFEAEAER